MRLFTGGTLPVGVEHARGRKHERMVVVEGVLAACAGVLLAAMESPHVRDKTRLDRLSIVLLAGTAAAIAAGLAFAIRQWITA